MEWRIIVPVLCLIGLLHVPGNAANSTNSTTTDNSTTAFQFNIVFHINDAFIETYSNMSNNTTIELKIKITTEVTAVFKHLTNFQRFDILQFRNGSIVVDGNLHFNNSTSKPIVANLTQILHNGNFTFPILTNFTTITEVTATAAPATTTTPATTVSRPANITTMNVVFRILQPFQDFHSNLSHPETKQLADNITNGFSPFFKRSFTNFIGMRIRKFSSGSIVADSIVEFDNTNNTSPNVTAVKNTLEEAIRTGNFSFTVDLTSINVTDITNVSTTTQAANNRSPVLASMLMALWMTLASLLVSAVMH